MDSLSINTAPKTEPDIGRAYRYKRLSLGLFLADMMFARSAPKAGDAFPPFELTTTDGNTLVSQDMFKDKPVLFVIGSLTCPMTASSTPHIKDLQDKFGDRIDFIMVDVREAHPGESVPQPQSMDEKLGHAKALKKFYDIQWTVAADNIDGYLHRALDPKPNSAFLTDSNGTIIFRSIWAGDYTALAQALKDAALGKQLNRKQSLSMIGPMSRAMGQVDATMKRGGPQAVKDMWLIGFPVALMGYFATYFSPLSPDHRGIASVLSLILVLIGVTAMFGFSMLE